MTEAEKVAMRLRSRIEDVILEVAPLYQELTTSDLQGIAMVKAQEIINLVKGSEGYKMLGFSHNLTNDMEDVKVCENLKLKSYFPDSPQTTKDLILEIYQDNKPCYVRL